MDVGAGRLEQSSFGLSLNKSNLLGPRKLLPGVHRRQSFVLECFLFAWQRGTAFPEVHLEAAMRRTGQSRCSGERATADREARDALISVIAPKCALFLVVSATSSPLSSVPAASRIDRIALPRYLPPSNHCRLGKIRVQTHYKKRQTSLTCPETKPPDLTRRRTSKPTLGPVARNHISYTHFPMSAEDYFARVKGNDTLRPVTPSAGTGKARTEILKTNLRAFKPTNSNMVSNSVNKTALHPGGVE